MTEYYYVAIAFALQLLSCFVAYQYLSNRTDGEIKFKDLFRVKFTLTPALAMGAVFAISAFIMCYCFLLNDDTFLRSWMNAEVFIWLAIVAYIDKKERIIPNHMIVIGLAFWAVLLLLEIFLAKTPWKDILMFTAVGGVAVGGVLFIIALFAKNGFGMGDVKMFFLLGLLYGLTDTYAILLFSIIIMAIVSLILLAIKKVNVKTAIPMAPFVVLGFILCILAGM